MPLDWFWETSGHQPLVLCFRSTYAGAQNHKHTFTSPLTPSHAVHFWASPPKIHTPAGVTPHSHLTASLHVRENRVFPLWPKLSQARQLDPGTGIQMQNILRTSPDFSAEALQVRREWDIFKVVREINCQSSILYPANLYLNNWKILSQINKCEEIHYHLTCFTWNAKGTYKLCQMDTREQHESTWKYKAHW